MKFELEPLRELSIQQTLSTELKIPEQLIPKGE